MVKGPRTTRQYAETREKGDEGGGPLDTNKNMTTAPPVGDGQQQSREVPTQPTTQEVSENTASKRNEAETEVSTETLAMEGETPTRTDLGKGHLS